MDLLQMETVLTYQRGQQMEGYFMLKSSAARVTNAGKTYLDLVLCDPTGEISAKWWDWNGNEEYPAPMLVKVRGTVDLFNNQPQLRVERMRETLPSDGLDPAQFVPSAPFPMEEMMETLWTYVERIGQPDIRVIVQTMLEDHKEALGYFPAALSNHHSFRSGLLHHTLTMARAAEGLLPVYRQLDADLLYAGVLLHDLCKVLDYDAGVLGLAKGYTRCGQLLGHIVKGVAAIEVTGRALGADEEIIELLQHMILSHHGIPEYGSPVLPMIPEAQVLHALDDLDAKLQDMDKTLSGMKPGQCSERIFSLQRRLYKAKYREE